MMEVPAVSRISRKPLSVTGYIVDQLIEMLADLVVDSSSVFHK